MKHKIFILLLLFPSINMFSQTLCRTDILNGEKIILENRVADFKKYDFSRLWLKTENNSVYGVIGDENQRILIKILSAKKNNKNPIEYFILGKSSVKGNICEFKGKITVQKIQTSERTNFGLDNEFENRPKTQGLLTAKYEFFENRNQKHSGTFDGELRTKWYLEKKDEVKYDNINAHSDGYFNNAFVGIWKMYNSKKLKKCNWGDYRVPNINCDFDIGVGEFNVAEKYRANGWLDITLRNKMPNGAIVEARASKAGKEWWQ